MANRSSTRLLQRMTFSTHVTVMACVLLLVNCPKVRSDAGENLPEDGNTFDFADVDTDGSGCVQGMDEKRKFRLYIGGILKDSLAMSDVERALQAGRITHSADINGDGKICECDLLTIFLTDSIGTGRRRHAFRVFEDGSIFDSADADGDGYLGDVKEKEDMTRKLAECVSDIKARTIVDAMSKLEKDDGKLARTEYMLFLNSPHHFPPVPGPRVVYPPPFLPHGSLKADSGPLLPPRPHQNQMGSARVSGDARPVVPSRPRLPPQGGQPPKTVPSNPRVVQQGQANPVGPSSGPVLALGPVLSKPVEGDQNAARHVWRTRPEAQAARPVLEPKKVPADDRPVESGARPALLQSPVPPPSEPIQNRPGPVQVEAKPAQDRPKPQRLVPPRSMLLSDGTRVTFPELPLAEDLERQRTTSVQTVPRQTSPRQPANPSPSPPQEAHSATPAATKSPSGPHQLDDKAYDYPGKLQGLANLPPGPVAPAIPVAQQSSSSSSSSARQPNPVDLSASAAIQTNAVEQQESVILAQPLANARANVISGPVLVVPLDLSDPPERQNVPSRPSGPKIQLDLENQLNPLSGLQPLNQPPGLHSFGSVREETSQNSLPDLPDYTNRRILVRVHHGRNWKKAVPMRSHPEPPAFRSAEPGVQASRFMKQPEMPVRSLWLRKKSVSSDTELERQLQHADHRQDLPQDELSLKIYHLIQQSRHSLSDRDGQPHKKQATTSQTDQQTNSVKSKVLAQPEEERLNDEQSRLGAGKLGMTAANRKVPTPEAAQMQDGHPRQQSIQAKGEVSQARPPNEQTHSDTIPASQLLHASSEAQSVAGQPNLKRVPENLRLMGQSRQLNPRPGPLKLPNTDQKHHLSSSAFHAMA